MSKQFKKLCLIVASLCLAANTSIYAQDRTSETPITSPNTVNGKTAPNVRKEIAFSQQGIIGKVHVKDGDEIKIGDILMEQDGQLELKRLEAMTIDADRSAEINAKTKDHENKVIELKRKKEMFESKALAESEYLQAQVDEVLSAANILVAEHDQAVKVAERDAQQIRVKQMQIISNINGIVEKINQTEGEVADANKPSIVVQSVDPLWINVSMLHNTVVAGLSKGQELRVRYHGGEWMTAKIIFIDQVDSKSQAQPIRLEMPNPAHKPTGLEIEVEVPAASKVAAQ